METEKEMEEVETKLPMIRGWTGETRKRWMEEAGNIQGGMEEDGAPATFVATAAGAPAQAESATAMGL